MRGLGPSIVFSLALFLSGCGGHGSELPARPDASQIVLALTDTAGMAHASVKMASLRTTSSPRQMRSSASSFYLGKYGVFASINPNNRSQIDLFRDGALTQSGGKVIRTDATGYLSYSQEGEVRTGPLNGANFSLGYSALVGGDVLSYSLSAPNRQEQLNATRYDNAEGDVTGFIARGTDTVSFVGRTSIDGGSSIDADFMNRYSCAIAVDAQGAATGVIRDLGGALVAQFSWEPEGQGSLRWSNGKRQKLNFYAESLGDVLSFPQ